MTTAYDVAYAYIGKTAADDSDELNTFINRYLNSPIDVQSTAWCAAFVNACLGQAGIQGTGELNAQSYDNWGTSTDSPVKGDLVVLWRGGEDSGLGHVGFVDHFSADKNFVYILGGNESHQVMIKAFDVQHVVRYVDLQ